MSKKRVLAIIPAFNEEKNVGKVISKVQRHPELIDTILVVDDHSTDNTSHYAKEMGAVVVRHEENLGVGAGIRTGIDYGIKNKFDIAVILSGDNQHEPDELPVVLGPVINSEFDVVQGSRYLKGGKTVNQTVFRKISTRFYTVLFFLFTFRRCSDVTNGFRAINIEKLSNDQSINIYQNWLNRYELEVYLLYHFYTSREYLVKEVPITIYYHGKKTNWTKMVPFVDWWRILRPIIFLRFGIKK